MKLANNEMNFLRNDPAGNGGPFGVPTEFRSMIPVAIPAPRKFTQGESLLLL